VFAAVCVSVAPEGKMGIVHGWCDKALPATLSAQGMRCWGSATVPLQGSHETPLAALICDSGYLVL